MCIYNNRCILALFSLIVSIIIIAMEIDKICEKHELPVLLICIEDKCE